VEGCTEMEHVYFQRLSLLICMLHCPKCSRIAEEVVYYKAHRYTDITLKIQKLLFVCFVKYQHLC
jgi:hypothetical protein